MAVGARGPGLNVAILGHSHDGKTTLAESLLFVAGATPRLGSTDQGTALLDYEPEEQRRHISVQLAIGCLSWRGSTLALLDAPGFQDFEGEVLEALSVADAAVLVVGANTGGQLPVGAESTWDLLAERELPRLIVLTKLDKEHGDFESTYAGLQRTLVPRPIALQIPIGAEHSFRGAVDLLSGRALMFDLQGGCTDSECPDDMADEAARRRQELVEAVAETDDEMLEGYLEGQEPSSEQLLQALHAAAAGGKLAPLLVAAPARALGARPVLDALASCLAPPSSGPTGDGPPTLYFFKTVADPFGKISYFRVLSGRLSADAHLVNSRTGEEERIARPLRPRGKLLDPIDHLVAGEIGAATKLARVATGDTLGPKGTAPSPVLAFPPTSYTMAIRPKAKGDEEKIHAGLSHILEEDPTLRIEREPGTHETLLHGLGDVHLEVTLEKLRRKYQVDAVLAVPHVPYRESIRGPMRQQHKYKKQSGGAGLYGDCTLEIEPLPRGAGFVWEDKIFGGAIPQPFRLSVEKGVRQALDQGALAGYPIVDVKVRLVDGSTHPVDGKDIAFQLAGAMAMREAVEKAGPYLLEPVMDVAVIVPASHMGDVIGHLNSRRGRIGGMTPLGAELEQVTAKVPLAEMYQFPIELRAATQGRGRYTMTFDHYDEVPAQVAQPIIAARQQLKSREPVSA
ncbi:MAG TPA: elongation factor G [Candidatus Dormibacteraeota bacterium]|nr:elongation factor G [Candidatus Dormibacteraeota bacterium]